jgi:NADH-quinone oxidoreductase subunit H
MTSLVSAVDFGSVGDPLFDEGITGEVLAILIVKILLVFVVLLVGTMFMVWFERKVVSDMQNRIGPNRAGPFGLLQTLADGTKLFFKEDLLPERADKRIFRLAPYLSVVPAFLTFAVIPLGGVVTMFGHDVRLQLADPPIGVLWLLVMSSISIYGVMLAGWSSGSKYPLLGSVRASAQMVSYEAALGLAVAAVVLTTGALETSRIVAEQMQPLHTSLPDWVHSWNLWKLAIVPAVVFAIAATAEMNRPPFDLVEAEQELVGGFHTEYSSLRFAMFFLAEFMNTITMSAVIVTLFLGGGDGPTFGLPGWLMYLVWFLAKTFVFMYTYVWLRSTLPRLRYDQLMDIGWKYLIPLTLGWLLVVAAATIKPSYAFYTLAGFCVAAALLYVAAQVGRERREEEEDDFGTPTGAKAAPPSSPSASEEATV